MTHNQSGMYRKTASYIEPIYCRKPECNKSCGLFHKCVSSYGPDCRPNYVPCKTSQSVDLPSTSSVTTISVHHTAENGHLVTPDRMGDVKDEPKALSVDSGALSDPVSLNGSTVTLDDIIASARRKIPLDYIPIVLPALKFAESDDPPSESFRKPFIRRHTNDSLTGIADIKDDYVRELMDSDYEDDLCMNDPPSLIIDDEIADFDELVRITQPPPDHFSNPLTRDTDAVFKKSLKLRTDVNEADDTSIADISITDVAAQTSPYLLPNDPEWS